MCNNVYVFLFSQALYIGQYKHGLYAFPSLVDDRTTFVASQTGRLLIEGPDRSTETSDSSTESSSTTKSPISVNLRLPSDMKIGWTDHSNTFNSAKPPITLFGSCIDCLLFLINVGYS